MPRTAHPQDDGTGETAIAERINATYLARTPASQRAFERATGVLPQGVSGGAKLYDPYPVYLARANGGHVWDVDGNRYVDFLMGAGPNILGHRHPAVQDAVTRQLGEIAQTLAPTLLEANLAERLRAHMPYLERIRFTNTGSEAVRTCLRAARAFTGRTGLAKFEGGFHGSDDPFLISGRSVAGFPDRPAPALDSAGIPSYVADDVLVLPYNDGPRAAALIDEHAAGLAAVFMEPVAFSTGGAIAASPEFARLVREATERNGVLLVFDEVVTCFRMGLEGSPAYLGVRPDLSAVGKAIGGGFPLAAMGGRAEVMEAVLGRPSLSNGKRIFQSGTFTGNSVSLAAGLATLEVIETEPVLAKIDALAERFRTGLRTLFAKYEVNAHVTGVRSVFQVHFGEHEPTSRRDILQGNTELVRLFLLGLVAEGVLWPPIHPGVTAYTHSEEDIDQALEAADRILPMFEAL
jgi:glutamate-1-semialdehyde 2,1-aminomutase